LHHIISEGRRKINGEGERRKEEGRDEGKEKKNIEH